MIRVPVRWKFSLVGSGSPVSAIALRPSRRSLCLGNDATNQLRGPNLRHR